ncbi:response regulator [Trichothermofontia sp.]
MATHKILVIDDSRVIRMRVREMLPEGDFEILEAKDGVEGLNLINQARPNLIMLDFLLPRMSGWEVYQQIQSHADLQLIPLVLMSGRKEEVTEKIQEPFEHFEFIEKPFERKALIEAIREAMRKAAELRRKREREVATTPATGGLVSSADVQALTQRVEHLEQELATLKKQMGQLLMLIKQRLGK